ncbi:MAG: hypothetical protein ABIN67_02070 [Ferruginibacter sp.]
MMIKKILRPLIPHFILERRKRQWVKTQLEAWHADGCSIPVPHVVKQLAIAYYQKKYSISTLVETGTFMGYMVEAQKKRFETIISIELGVELFKNAKQRFLNDKNVTIVQGDSGKVLPELLKKVTGPAIFWLDGHYSEGATAKGNKDCPIFEELDAIFSNSNYDHILLIDDASHFIGIGDYPTIEQLTDFIRRRNAKYKVEVNCDIIRYTIQV